MSGRSRLLTWGLPVFGAVALVAGITLVVLNRPVVQSEQPPRSPPTTCSQSSGDIDATRYIGAIGVTEPPFEPIAIAPHVGGVVNEVLVELGDTLKQGQPLLRIDRRRADASVAVKQAQVAVARNEVDALRALIPSRRASVESAEAAFEEAQQDVQAVRADQDDAQRQYVRAGNLLETDSISEEEFEQRRFALEKSAALVAAARSNVTEAGAAVAMAKAELARLLADDGSSGPDIAVAETRLLQTEEDLESAITERELHTVLSPVAGRVLRINIRPGEYAVASDVGEPLMVLGRLGATHLRVEIDEADTPRFNPSAPAWASPRGDASTRHLLELAYVEPLVTPKSNLSGSTRELVDTRVLQAVYKMPKKFQPLGIGQQFDVYIESESRDR